MNNQNKEFANLRACCDDSPRHNYEFAKLTRRIIGDAMDEFMATLRANGFKADNCDAAHACEAAMYAYVKQSNPDSWPTFASAEGFGEHGPCRFDLVGKPGDKGSYGEGR